MKNKRILALCLLLVLCLTACGENTIFCPPAESTGVQVIVCPAVAEPDESRSFSDNLLFMTEGEGNRMLSPYSAKMCLALLANGAEGETKQQILDAIGIDNLDAYNGEVKALLERYDSYSEAMTLNTANSLWLNQTAFGGEGEFLAGYQSAMQDYFSAEVRDVTDKNSIEEVNSWVKEKTNGKIEEILMEGHRTFTTALVNAVYFKAGWETEFSEHLTEKGDFTNADGSVSKTDFMHNTDSYGYYAADGIQAIKLNYSRFGSEADEYIRDKDYDFSMYLVLSEETPRIEELLNTAEFKNSRVQLSVPKFEIEYSFSAVDILLVLGMTDAFDGEKADFGAMIDLSKLRDNLYVSEVLQNTYIQIDEKGTEAAAATAIIMTEAAAMIDTRPIIEFTADKPFYFAVRDNTSGELLFVGRYETVK